MLQRQLEHELCCRGGMHVPAASARDREQVIVERLKNGVWVQIQLAHYLCKQIPFHLCKGEEQMLGSEHGMVPPARLLHRAVDDTLRRLAQFAWWNVQFVHGAAPSTVVSSKSGATNTLFGAGTR